MQLPIKIIIPSQMDYTVKLYCYISGETAVNEVFYSRFKFILIPFSFLFLHGSDSYLATIGT